MAKKWVLVKREFRVGVYLFSNNAVLGLGLGLGLEMTLTLTLTLKQPFFKKKDRPQPGVLLTPPKNRVLLPLYGLIFVFPLSSFSDLSSNNIQNLTKKEFVSLKSLSYLYVWNFNFAIYQW